MDRDKIARVAERIRTLPPEQFNMDVYCDRGRSGTRTAAA